jgi:hypothetical protein
MLTNIYFYFWINDFWVPRILFLSNFLANFHGYHREQFLPPQAPPCSSSWTTALDPVLCFFSLSRLLLSTFRPSISLLFFTCRSPLISLSENTSSFSLSWHAFRHFLFSYFSMRLRVPWISFPFCWREKIVAGWIWEETWIDISHELRKRISGSQKTWI